MNLKGRSLLTLLEITPDELTGLMELSVKVKAERRRKEFPRRLAGKNIALIFEKASTRTRCSFVVAAVDEGAHAETLGKGEMHLGEKEDIRDTARVLSRLFDGIEFRGHEHATVEALARHATVPVWNGLTDDHHPTQALADVLTLAEEFGGIHACRGRTVCYVGDGANNTAASLMLACAMVGMNFVVASPEEWMPNTNILGAALKLAKETGGSVRLESRPHVAVRGADCLYTDVWVSMGEEHKPHARAKVETLRGYQINSDLLAASGNSSCIFLHCLPANKGLEVSEDVFEGPASRVFEQAENRLHTIKALLLATML